ncbi:hypothetical protein [Haloactinospora alba]|uniref:hypothetical protein n=1 Tax=Haloactinospora alba TaxID=405555 RepID=UPI00114FD128|nr:hypothetical protein [Haloactinospora alba]
MSVDTAVALGKATSLKVRSQVLIGWGERWFPGSAPSHLRGERARQPRNPDTGQELVTVSFTAAGRADRSNPLLAHLRHYRPDLLH